METYNPQQSNDIAITNSNRKTKALDMISKLKGGLIVSCQALPGEPLYCEDGHVMAMMATAAAQGRAVGIRANGTKDIKAIMTAVDLPLIGLIKKIYPNSEAYITPTMDEVDQLVVIGCPIIAFECTRQKHAGNLTSKDFLQAIRKKYPNQLFMADCSTLEDAKIAQAHGADFIGTTMSGYVPGDIISQDPDFCLVKSIVEEVDLPVIAEGRIHTPEQAGFMLQLGAMAVVVGGAITRPLEITNRFVHEINMLQSNK